MIKLIEKNKEFDDFFKDDIFYIRIMSLLKAYSTNYNFALFYKQLDDNGNITSIISRLDNDYTVCHNDDFDLIELEDFFTRIGFNSILGDDENGKSIFEHSKRLGYNMENSLFLKNESTPTYMAILNHQGEMESAVVDMESLNKMDKNFIDEKDNIFENAKYTIVDSDNPELLEYILKKYECKSNFILDPVSAKKAKKIRHLIKYFHLKMME